MAKRQVDILFFVEHIARELDIACAVKHLVGTRHGLCVEIASLIYNLRATIRNHHPPSVVVIPYGYSALEPGVFDLLRAWPHGTFVNLAWEQIFQNINRSYKAPRDNFARRHVLHVVWSNFVKEYLAGHGTVKDNIIVNGNPTLALYRRPYRKYFDTRRKLARVFNLDPEKRWVFVPENYGAAFYTTGRLRNYVRRGATKTTAYSYRDFALASLQKVVHWFSQAAAQANVEIIVRPRPATPRAKFQDFCARVAGALPDRLHILKDGTVREWVMASDCVVSSYSTTLIEAAVAQRPVFMLEPIAFPEFLYNDWYELVPKIRDFSSFISVVEGKSAEDRCWQPLHEWARSSMLNGGDPIANIADLLSAIYRREKGIPSTTGNPGAEPLPQAPWGYRARHQLGLLMRDSLFRIRGLANEHYPSYECDTIRESDIAARVDRWKQVLDSDGSSAEGPLQAVTALMETS